ncbi:MAG: tetratricopeptide repeat protein [Acidimicrobiales bacterium]|nr:tetratricopeptide repeat protein [Hyphomonadaceae bacterium]RZV44604.1 MAG: tetratricopeptide repeat protein [Acidimicrobiales bacterium]
MLKRVLVASFLTFCMSSTASAQLTVIGNGAAKDCYHSVKHGDPGRIGTIKACEGALDELSLKLKDRAATHVNIGILYMRKKDYEEAEEHYNKALKMADNVSEIHINLSANYIYTGRYQEAITAANTAIEMGTDKMPEVLFNRAMAYDHLKQYTKAYNDLKKALELRPDWPVALNAIDNYEVVPAPKPSNG